MAVILSPSQEATVEAFRTFLNNPKQNEFLISGFAGSGKSYLVEYLVDITAREFKVARMIDPKAVMQTFFFTATTNKAANVLSAMLNQPTSTVHKLLGLVVQTNYKTGKLDLVKKDNLKNLTNSIVFIDEASMITRELLKHIQDASSKYPSCKMVYIGDNYQLPPVEEDMCPIFQADIPTYFLREIQRQVAGSPIIQLSSKYREMLDDSSLEWPVIVPDNQTIFHYLDKDKWFAAVEQAFKRQTSLEEVKILAWTNERVREYNTWIRNFLGQTGEYAIDEIVQSNKPIFEGDGIFAPTDSVHRILSVNNYTVTDDVEGYEIGLYNIHQGTVITVFQPKDWKEANRVASDFAKEKNWKDFYRIKNNWVDLRATHAQTVHKSQGSTYQKVFIDYTNVNKNERWEDVARLAYVAITRASDEVHIFGNLAGRHINQPAINYMGKFPYATKNH